MPVGFEVDDVWKARGRGFQMATLQPEGVPIHLTGQVAWDDSEQIVGLGDVATQTRQCFDNIARLLAAVGGELGDIVSITTYLVDRSDLAAVQAVRTQYLPANSEPVSTSVIVAGLGHEDFLVELTPVAVIPFDRYRKPAA